MQAKNNFLAKLFFAQTSNGVKKNKNPSDHNLQQGFSLVEMIVLIFIVGILFNLVIMEVESLIISRKQKYEDIAYHIANKEMESLRATSFDDLPSSGNISDTQLNQIPSGSGNFTVTDYTGYSGLKQLTVTVVWNDGSSKSVVLNTIAGKGGLNP